MNWHVLGIEPTKDKKAITAAYRARLKMTNPEDKPEEFKALRAAYEEAIRLADQADAPAVRDESPVGLWMEKITGLYADFSARIQSENWRQLLSDDVCVGLDTRPLAEDALLHFLMENYFVPHSVWLEMDAVFAFSERAQELCESYPADFIEHAVLSGIRYEPSLSYELFVPGENGAACDDFRRLYYQASQTPLNQLGAVLDQMEALPEQHPYGKSMRCRWYLENGQREAGVEGFRKLAEEYPDNIPLNMDWAAICLEDGNWTETEEIVRRILDREPAHKFAKQMMADCLAAKEQFDEAKELLYDLMHACGDDPVYIDQCAQRLRVWNEQLIGKHEEKMKADPADSENAIELAWCYIQNEAFDQALEIAAQIDPAAADPFDYHNLLGKLHHNMQNFDDAVMHLEMTADILEHMEPDGTAETAKKIRRLPEMLQVLGNSLMQVGRQEEARAKFEQALAMAPENPEVLTIMGRILYASGEFEQCVEILDQLLQVSPGSWFGEVIRSLALCKLHRDKDAFDAINRALAMQGGDLSLYIQKMQILIRNGVFEEVHAILDFLKEAGAPEDIAVDWIKAQLTELEEKNEEKAFRQYQTIARKIESGADMMHNAQLYYRMAMLMAKKMDANRESDREILMTLLDKGLAHDRFDEDCLSLKAWLLRKSGKLPEAIAMYRALGTAGESKLAELYYQDLNSYAGEALACYEEMLQKRQTPELYFYAATCKRHLGDFEGARQYYLRELELDPMDIDGFNGLGFVCEALGRYEDALEQINKALDVMWETENFFPWLVEHQLQVLRRLGRHQQAIAAVDDVMSRCDYPNGWQMKFDICCQFGLWDQAKQILDQWQKARRNDVALTTSTGKLHLLNGKMLKATLAMAKVKHKISYDEEMDFRLQLADLECNHKRQVQIWNSRVQDDPGSDHALMSLALACWWNGNRDAAREHARRALELLDEILKQNLVDEALYRSRRSVLLAILGRTDDARAELAQVRKLPLCEYCAYGSCKDADIFEGYIEEIAGNREKAADLYRTGRKNWPDELDFVSGETRMKKKGK